MHVDRLGLRIERPSPGNAVDDEEEGVDLAQSPQLRHAAGRTGIAAGHDGDSAGERQRTRQVAGVCPPQLLAADDGDGRRHGEEVFLDQGGRHFDRFADVLGLLLREGGSGEKGHADEGRDAHREAAILPV